VALWLVVEIVMVIFTVTGRRAAVGGNVYAQIALAVALLIILNAVAFHNYYRFDCTRSGEFTLPSDLVTELQTLRDDSPTDVVVLKRHKTAIAGAAKRDDVDSAAEQKIVEKVNDLVDQLRELGPRFHVTVLDTEARNYFKQLEELPPEVRDAVENAPEDSIFFHANKRVRRMSF